jgi:hypothetical protein
VTAAPQTPVELRVYLPIPALGRQFAAYLGTPTRARGYPPIEGESALIIEVAPALAIERVIDLALKAVPEVEPGIHYVEVHAPDPQDVQRAGQAMLDGIGARAEDTLRPRVTYVDVIEDVTDRHAVILNRNREGSMLLPGQSLLVAEMTPALFAAAAISTLLRNRSTLLCYAAAGLCLMGTALGSLNKEPGYVRGYEDAAKYVIEHTHASRFCLFDNYLNGNFIFQIRTHDPERRLWVLRGDKLFYAVLSDPHTAYKEFAHGKEDILSDIFKYDPEYIVVEDPQINFDLRAAALLRTVLRDSTDRFRLEKTIPIRSNVGSYKGVSLLIYRNTLRNPHPSRLQGLEMIGLGHQINSGVPDSGKVDRAP